MHVARRRPAAAQYVAKDDVPAESCRRRRRSTGPGRSAGKPANVQEKIAEGKLKEFYGSYCLLEQPFVKEPKLTIGQLVQEKIAVIKENIVIRRFVRFRLGEESSTPKPAAE